MTNKLERYQFQPSYNPNHIIPKYLEKYSIVEGVGPTGPSTGIASKPVMPLGPLNKLP